MSIKVLTRQQVKATLPERTVWVGASAGTGKTHVLIARFLRLMLEGTSPDRILAITFTRAAAAEMANRLRTTLSRWVGLGDQRLAAEIMAATGETAGRSQLQRARELFGLVLDLPGGLHIQTIHAFCQSVLARFPLEAGLSPGFRVMDERTADEVLRESVNIFLGTPEQRGESDREKALATLSEAAVGEFEDLVKIASGERGSFEALSRQWGGLSEATVEMRRRLGLGKAEREADILRAAFSRPECPREQLIQLADALESGSGAEQKRAELIRAQLATSGHDMQRFDPYRSVFLTQAGKPRKTIATANTETAHPGVRNIAAAEATRLESLEGRLALARVAERTEALYAVAEGLFGAYATLKRRRNLVDYDDLIDMSLRLLSEPGMSPWILYKLDGGIDHILIDEAQDTNPAQWELIERLTEEFYAGEGAAPGPRTIFAVGDRKQSIFSFQGAVPDAFLVARDRIGRKAKQAGAEFHRVDLDLSFRSTDAVLALVDTLFGDQPGHRVNRTADAGLVELWPTERAQSEREAPNWQAAKVQGFPADAQAALAQRVGAKIADLINSGDELPSRGTPIRPGDIMVLVRRRTSFVDLLVKALKDRAIPVAGIDRIRLLDQLAIQDLLVLGDFVLLPEDDLTLATLLKSPLIGLGEEALFELAFDRDEASLWDILKTRAVADDSLASVRDELADALGCADYLNPYEFFARILSDRRGRKKLVARLGEDANDPLDEFLSMALQYEQIHAPSLSGFLRWFRSGTSEIKRDMEAGRDEVRVLTIHGAKGLQAPIVFLPDTCQLPPLDAPILKLPDPDHDNGPQFLLWPGSKTDERGPVLEARESADRATLAEYDRLLYVAVTRAADRLYISGWEGKSGRPQGCWYDRILHAFDRLEDVAIGTDQEGREIRYVETAQRQRPSRPRSGVRPVGEAIQTPDWISTKPPIETLSTGQPVTGLVAPSQPAYEAGSGIDEAAERGVWLHSLIERLADIAPARRAAMADRLISEIASYLSAETRAELAREALALFDDPDLAHLFAANSVAEVAIEGQVGTTWLRGRIDRLVVADDYVLLVDFKTGRNPPRSPEQIAEEIIGQLAGYRSLIAQIYPDREIRAAILWTANRHLMRVPEELLAQVKMG